MSDLKVLCDATVSLLGEHGRILDPRVSPCRYVSDDGLLVSAVRVIIRAGGRIIATVVVVVLLRVVRGEGIVTRVV